MVGGAFLRPSQGMVALASDRRRRRRREHQVRRPSPKATIRHLAKSWLRAMENGHFLDKIAVVSSRLRKTDIIFRNSPPTYTLEHTQTNSNRVRHRAAEKNSADGKRTNTLCNKTHKHCSFIGERQSEAVELGHCRAAALEVRNSTRSG